MRSESKHDPVSYPGAANGTMGPWWNSLAVTLLKQGISACIAVYMVWWVTSNLGTKLENMAALLFTHVTASTKTEEFNERSDARELLYQRAMIKIAAETCKQQANTSATARYCDDLARNWMNGQ